MSAPNLDEMFFEDSDAADAAELTQKTLIDTQERMGMVLDHMPMGLLVHTEQGIIFANQEACRLLQVGRAEVVGHHFLDYVEPAEAAAASQQFSATFGDVTALYDRETRISRPDGDELHIKLITCRLPWQGNPVIQVLLQDVTDLKHTEQKLRRLSITDELTGAFNRRHAFYEAALYVDPDRQPPIPLSCIMLDIDHFKVINDTHGHAAGDQALIQLSRKCNDILASTAQADSAMFARIGGEEFLVLLPGMELEAAAALAETLRQSIATIQIDTPTGHFSFTCSMGVGIYRDADRSFDALLSRCDAALYAAKDAGRDRVKLA